MVRKGRDIFLARGDSIDRRGSLDAAAAYAFIIGMKNKNAAAAYMNVRGNAWMGDLA